MYIRCIRYPSHPHYLKTFSESLFLSRKGNHSHSRVNSAPYQQPLRSYAQADTQLHTSIQLKLPSHHLCSADSLISQLKLTSDNSSSYHSRMASVLSSVSFNRKSYSCFSVLPSIAFGASLNKMIYSPRDHIFCFRVPRIFQNS